MRTTEKNFFKLLLIMFAFIIILSLGSSASADGIANVSTADEFKAAVDNSATEINVMADIDLTNAGTLDVSRTTINLNGNKISNCNDNNTGWTYIQGTDFTIKNGTFDSMGSSYGLFIGDIGTTDNVIIENINLIGGINVFNSTNVVLKNVNVTAANYYAIWCDENGHVIVKSGSFTSSGVAVIGMSLAVTSLDIEGGTFTTPNNSLVLQGNFNIPTIKDGTFNVPVEEKYCAEGYEPVQLGESNYSVCNHSNTTTKNAVNPTCTTTGYSGDIYCSKCNKLIKNGEVIGITDHKPSEWNFDKENHWKECSECKITIPDSLTAHKFDTNGKCEVCSYRDENATTTLKDNQTDIKLDFKNSVLEDNVILEVVPVPDGATYENIKSTLSDVKDFIAFDINLLHNGVKVQPNGNVLISIPIPEKFDKTKLTIYRIDGENKTEYNGKLTVIDNKNYIQFETNHFSHYILAEKEVSNPTPQTPTTDTTSAIVQNETKALERKLDNEPKAGVFDTTLFVEVIFALSISGYIICKKKSV